MSGEISNQWHLRRQRGDLCKWPITLWKVSISNPYILTVFADKIERSNPIQPLLHSLRPPQIANSNHVITVTIKIPPRAINNHLFAFSTSQLSGDDSGEKTALISIPPPPLKGQQFPHDWSMWLAGKEEGRFGTLRAQKTSVIQITPLFWWNPRKGNSKQRGFHCLPIGRAPANEDATVEDGGNVNKDAVATSSFLLAGWLVG